MMNHEAQTIRISNKGRSKNDKRHREYLKIRSTFDRHYRYKPKYWNAHKKIKKWIDIIHRSSIKNGLVRKVKTRKSNNQFFYTIHMYRKQHNYIRGK